MNSSNKPFIEQLLFAIFKPPLFSDVGHPKEGKEKAQTIIGVPCLVAHRSQLTQICVLQHKVHRRLLALFVVGLLTNIGKQCIEIRGG